MGDEQHRAPHAPPSEGFDTEIDLKSIVLFGFGLTLVSLIVLAVI